MRGVGGLAGWQWLFLASLSLHSPSFQFTKRHILTQLKDRGSVYNPRRRLVRHSFPKVVRQPRFPPRIPIL